MVRVRQGGVALGSSRTEGSGRKNQSYAKDAHVDITQRNAAARGTARSSAPPSLPVKPQRADRPTTAHKAKWTVSDGESTEEIKHQWKHQTSGGMDGDEGGRIGVKQGEM